MLLKVEENTLIAKDTFYMRISGDTTLISAPGQFINISLDGFFLRRPISICDWSDGTIELIYKVVGNGTKFMSDLKPGINLDALTGLGNGFTINNDRKPVLVGGGVGSPPLLALAKFMVKKGMQPSIVLGFNESKEVPEFLVERFKNLDLRVIVATVDGSRGYKGLVTDAMSSLGIAFDRIYACGPLPMLKAIHDKFDVPGQYSFEARMACGFGACMGCTIQTSNGPRRVCKDGPVFQREEIIW